jgi:predicted nucleotidyltransferase component of viral defense system
MLNKKFLEEYIKENGIPKKPRQNLTEYLQAEILAAIYDSEYGKFLSFIGGTCLRFAYNIERFSEDLDFDLIKSGFDCVELAEYLEKKLKELGFKADAIAKKTENIFIIYVKFSEVMKEMQLSPMAGQKLMVKFEVDPNPPKHIKFESRRVNAYGKAFNIIANELDSIFAQKVLAIMKRPYQKGRDFYDLVWFLGQYNLEPSYEILREKRIPVANRAGLVEALQEKIAKSDLKKAAEDVERFLFHPEQAKWILDLPKYLEDYAKHKKT